MRFFRSLIRLFTGAPAATTASVPPSHPSLPPTRLTLNTWRASAERVAYAAELLRNPLFQELLGMLAGVRAVHRGTLDATTAAFLLGQRTGCDLVLGSLLEAGTSLPAAPEPLPLPDYAAANTLAAWESEADAL